jgi:hypothetical protein
VFDRVVACAAARRRSGGDLIRPTSDPSTRSLAQAWPAPARPVPSSRGQRHHDFATEAPWACRRLGRREQGNRHRSRQRSGPELRSRPLPGGGVLRYTEVTWAEDRATRGRDPSADSGAKTGVGSRMLPLCISGIGPKAINPFRRIARSKEYRGAPPAVRTRGEQHGRLSHANPDTRAQTHTMHIY